MFSSNTSQVSNAATYIEDVFSTYLYTGNGSTQTITNGIDLSTYGGLVWIKDRSQGTGYHHILQDTARGASWCLFSNLTNAQSQDSAGTNFAFNNNGFFIGSSNVKINGSDNYTSWTFRKQPKFFDVVTYTGNGANRTIAHNLGSVPGCIIIKSTSNTSNWAVYHRSLTDSSYYLVLNSTSQEASNTAFWNSTAPTATEFSLGTIGTVNGNGLTYVAYLFAHNAGGFGLTGTDNVVSCGVYTGNGSASGPVVTLNYEPQWLIIKKIDGSGGAWWMADTMRGFDNTSDQFLWANSSTNEIPKTNYVKPTATGFQIVNTDFDVNEAGARYIYIAIRRGPMKTPTSGTSVFGINAFTGDGSGTRQITTQGVTTDLILSKIRSGYSGDKPTMWTNRLRGGASLGISSAQGDMNSYWSLSGWYNFAVMDGYAIGGSVYAYSNQAGGTNYVSYGLRRAPSVFDVVNFTAVSSTNQRVNHNLTVAPELIITKEAAANQNQWFTYSASLGRDKWLDANANAAASTYTNIWGTSDPTATDFGVFSGALCVDGSQYITYLFASCPGVSKVGTYSGTGATQTISCGFAARFVMIKRTNSTGDWWFWDTTRGMVAGTDPRSSFNGIAPENNANWVYTDASGFQIVTTDATVNASGGSYIYLAIA